ncbi:alpha/beta hydrolase [Streptomyces sp. NBC_01020]|uniref:alpha/beta fold hydrolase n=1 Tax=unclassified Streptomyces TaxID=2593676 RepID=UPI002E1ED49D|nr:alpha/beta hydrolase [Streptomyces sp. NBC_01020]WSX68134.1 alpha/beta hydrolase [Streptomyces sp. NBC_00932]
MPYFTTTTDGTRLHYIDYGDREADRTLVFINSAYFGTEMWERQMLPLAADGYRCVGLDRRGHGRSDDVWGGFDLDTLADDIGALLDHLGLTDVTLVGHSLGAAEAVRYLTRHGSARVARLALVAGLVPGLVRTADHPGGLDPAAVERGNEAIRRDRYAFFADGVDAFFALQLPENQRRLPDGRHPENRLSDAYMSHLAARCTGATLRATAAMCDLVVTLDLAPEMSAIDVPALVVHGTHDASTPLDLTGRRSAALIPESELRIYENAGHGLFATHGDRLTADLREFAKA